MTVFFIALKTICTLRRGKKGKKIRLIFGPKNEKSRFLTVFLKMHRTEIRYQKMDGWPTPGTAPSGSNDTLFSFVAIFGAAESEKTLL